MRLFAALELSDDVRYAIDDWWQQACSHLDENDWRYVPSHLWHVTLAFYGDVSGKEADDLAESLAQCAKDAPIQNLILGGTGIFPKPARPNVFWLGVNEAEAVGELKNLARCCRHAGHATVRKASEEARFRGHVTLARYRGDRHGLAERSWESMSEPPAVEWEAVSFSLFQSILRPQGPQYRKLETFKCSAPGVVRKQ